MCHVRSHQKRMRMVPSLQEHGVCLTVSLDTSMCRPSFHRKCDNERFYPYTGSHLPPRAGSGKLYWQKETAVRALEFFATGHGLWRTWYVHSCTHRIHHSERCGLI